MPVPGVPFKESWGVILNQKGRVLNPETQQPQVGEGTVGWIKRGPNGVIGTNKPDAVETVMCMLEDLAHGQTLTPARPDVAAQPRLIEAWSRTYLLRGLAAPERDGTAPRPGTRSPACEVHQRGRDAGRGASVT